MSIYPIIGESIGYRSLLRHNLVDHPHWRLFVTLAIILLSLMGFKLANEISTLNECNEAAIVIISFELNALTLKPPTHPCTPVPTTNSPPPQRI